MLSNKMHSYNSFIHKIFFIFFSIFSLSNSFIAGRIPNKFNRLKMSQSNKINRESNNFIDNIKSSLEAERNRVIGGNIEVALSNKPSELPESFDDAVMRASKICINAIENGYSKIRIDFDTSIGDQTYTSLKNTLPMARELVKYITDMYKIEGEDTLRIFFPDMGAAALARRDWKMGTNASEVPTCVRTANMQNDPLEVTDKITFLLCPLSYEADYVKRIIDLSQEKNIPCIMINPNLINMDQGYGLRARAMRNELLNPFLMCYKLKTLTNGAIVREWPDGFSLWMDDEKSEGGYKLLQSYVNDPPNEAILDLLDINMPVTPKASTKNNEALNGVVSVVKQVNNFFQGLSRL